MRVVLGVFLLLVFVPASAEEEIRVDVRQGATSGIAVAVAAAGDAAREVAGVVSADLSRSGLFQVHNQHRGTLSSLSARDFDVAQWRKTDAEYVIGTHVRQAGDRIEVSYRIWDLMNGEALPGKRFVGPQRLWRRLAHQLADSVHEYLTDVPGAFDTRLAYIRRTGSGRKLTYTLYVCDVDGHNPVSILSSVQPLLSPVWSPDGKSLAYVSLERGQAQVHLQDLRSGKRRALPSNRVASNAPAFSPDGQWMAMTLTVGRNQEIFLYNLQTEELQRLTNHPAIDTEPAWEPSGRAIVFTSDRSGRARLYRQALDEAQARALPIPSQFSAAAAEVSEDGRYVAFVQSAGLGQYSVVMLEPESGAIYPLSRGILDESPSFAPNSQSLIYSSTLRNGEQVLMVSSYNGIIQKRLNTAHTNLREPAWSPYRH